nr:hypothetical protein [Tanacetum cinerariifolium]
MRDSESDPLFDDFKLTLMTNTKSTRRSGVVGALDGDLDIHHNENRAHCCLHEGFRSAKMLNQEPCKWTRVVGSYGYMAPEIKGVFGRVLYE